MKQTISQRQFIFLAANAITASIVIVLTQSLSDKASQNAWIVPFFLFLFIVVLVNIGLFRLNKIAPFLEKEKDMLDGKNWTQKCLAALFVLFIGHILVSDIRLITEFVHDTLLPQTPMPYVISLFVFTSFYIAWGGVEVIARLTEIFFTIYIGVVLFLPFSLIERIELENFEPILEFHTLPATFQATYLGLAYVGEIIILFLIIGSMQPVNKTKRSLLIGGAIGLGTFFINVLCQIAVLGAEIIRYLPYPGYTLVQHIRITDFLDRLDMIIVALYLPMFFAKTALLLFGLHRAVSILTRTDAKVTMLPLALSIAILANVLFANKVMTSDFLTHTWATLGLILEFLIIFFMILAINGVRRKGKLQLKATNNNKLSR